MREKTKKRKKKDPLFSYKMKKIKLLEDFTIHDLGVEYFQECNSEEQVDRKVRDLIMMK